MLVSDELNKRGRGRNPKYTARAQPVRHPRRGWHGLGPDAGTWRSSQVFSPTKAVDKVRALPELRKQDAAQYIARFCRNFYPLRKTFPPCWRYLKYVCAAQARRRALHDLLAVS